MEWNSSAEDASLASIGMDDLTEVGNVRAGRSILPLVTECLKEDRAIARQRRRCNPYTGNLLRVVDDDDGGRPRVLHVQGEHMHELALRTIRGYAGDAGGPPARSPPPAIATCPLPPEHRDRLLQLSLCASDENRGSPRRIAARSTYWVHHFHLVNGTLGPPTLHHVASAKNLGHARPLDVALNPALRAEAACLMDDGRLHLLRLDRVASARGASAGSSASAGSAASSAAMSTCEYITSESGCIPLFSGQQHAPPMHDEPWGAVEYAEHPLTLYLASGKGLHLADTRAPSSRPALLFDARTLPLPELRAGSMAAPHSTRLLPCESAGGGGGGDGANQRGVPSAPLVAIASREQLIVLDARAAHTPLHQLRMPMPLPPPCTAPTQAKENSRFDPVVQPGYDDDYPQPRYTIEFSRCNGALLLVEMTTARPFLVPLTLSSASTASGGGGIDGDVESARSCASWLHGEQHAHHVPRTPILPINLDRDGVLHRRLDLMDTLSAGMAVPLAGAAVFPLPRKTGPAAARAPAAGGGLTWAVAAMSASGDVDVLCEDEAAVVGQTANLTAQEALLEREKHADAVVTSELRPPYRPESPAPSADDENPWLEIPAEKVQKKLEQLRSKISAASAASAPSAAPAASAAPDASGASDASEETGDFVPAPGAPVAADSAAAAPASAASSSAAPAAASAGLPPSIKPFVLRDEDDPLTKQLASQWDEWASTMGFSTLNAPTTDQTDTAAPPRSAGSGRASGAATSGSGSADALSMPPPPPRLSVGQRLSVGSSHRSPGLVSAVGASTFGSRKAVATTPAAAASAAQENTPSAASSSRKTPPGGAPPQPSSDPFKLGRTGSRDGGAASKKPRRSSGF